MPAILFVCTRNLYRSPVAAHLFTDLLVQRGEKGEFWVVESAGTWVVSGEKLPQGGVDLVKELGVDLSTHKARDVADFNLDDYDLILVMEAGQKEALSYEFPTIKSRVFQLAELADFPFDIPDPGGSDHPHLVEIYQELKQLVFDNYGTICELARQNQKKPSAR